MGYTRYRELSSRRLIHGVENGSIKTKEDQLNLLGPSSELE